MHVHTYTHTHTLMFYVFLGSLRGGGEGIYGGEKLPMAKIRNKGKWGMGTENGASPHPIAILYRCGIQPIVIIWRTKAYVKLQGIFLL